ncbi:MAG: alpha-amylase/4-alpha-glucanotransferase domain-containing protein [Candidatus Brocadiia bacterium]
MERDKATLVFVIHNHQPVGNFDKVFRRAFDRAYSPYLEVAEKFEGFRFGLHVSGPLFEWLEANEPRYLDRLAALSEEGRVEMLGGAFFEAILTMLSDGDAAEQLGLMNEYIQKRFGTRPRGMWLAERVWEPNLVKTIAASGLEYTFTDDHHFKVAGFAPDSLDGYFVSEDRGRTLAIFPISEKLRYLIPFKEQRQVIEYLRSFVGRNSVVVYGDDGEKFGLWPHTHRSVYTDSWLVGLLGLLEKNSDWLDVKLPKDAMDAFPPRGRAFLPDCSYREMTEWSLPVDSHRNLIQLKKDLTASGMLDRCRPFLKGGSWRNFRARYSESANMYALQAELSAILPDTPKLRKSKKLSTARRHLLRSQCDCAYWHGVFGGLYLPHLRDEVYSELIQAQAIAVSEGLLPSFSEGDFDLDGIPDIRLASKNLVAYVKPSSGGAVRALNILGKGVNLANVLARHSEVYHADVPMADVLIGDPDSDEFDDELPAESIHSVMPAKEHGLARYLVYDWHDRSLFQEHFVPESVQIDDMALNLYRDEGDFTVEPYRVTCHDQSSLKMARDGAIWRNGIRHPIRMEKSFHLLEDRIEAEYTLSNPGTRSVDFRLGVESNFGMSGGDSYLHHYFDENGQLGRFKIVASLSARKMLGLADDWRKFSAILRTDKTANFWMWPVYTVSQSESGFEKVFQCAAVMPVFELSLPAGGSTAIRLSLEIMQW